MLSIGTKVYYTGDMANQDGHFVIVGHRNGYQYDLSETEGNRVFKGVMSIAAEYKGHCGDRFVTREAWEANKQARIAEMRRDTARRSYLAHQAALREPT